MSAFTGDSWLDDELRSVAIPAELLAKLSAIADLDDSELDRALANVAVPAGLFDRLRAIGTLDEVDVEDELRHVVVPAPLLPRLRRIPAAARRLGGEGGPWRQLAIAASLLVAVGVGYVAAISSSWFTRPVDQHREVAAKADRSATEAAKSGHNNVNRKVDREDPLFPPLPLAAEESPAPPNSLSADAGSSDLANSSVPTVSTNEIGNAAMFTEALAAPSTAERLPPLRSISTPVWRGVSPPRERGYDLAFQLRHGVHPRVSPAASKALEACQVPLVTSTASFDAAYQLTSLRKLPPGHRIRAEEFLAAMDYDFAPPQNRSIAIRSAVAPSPWSAGLSLLQVAVQARSVSAESTTPHLIVVLDAAPSIDWESRRETALLGVSDYVAHMPSASRLSLIVSRPSAVLIADRQDTDDAVKTIQKLRGESPDRRSSADIAGAIAKAAEAARSGPSSSCVVLLTDGLSELDEKTEEQTKKVLAQLRQAGHRFNIIDIRQDETIDARLSRFAAAANGTEAGADGRNDIFRHAGASQEVRRAIAEAATGRAQVVANRATMKVTFKPDAVATYRLLGHEATSVVGLMSSTIEADLYSGDAATGLFEVEMKPDGGETVATVEVTWHNPSSGATEKITQTVSRLQLSPSFYQAPMSLQLAALAAETAEILRDSPFSPPNTHSLSAVAELSAQLNPRLRARPSFAKLVSLIERAQRSQPISR